MICQDGFITSHAVENILLEEDAAVKAFVGEYHPEHALIGRDHPLAVGPYDTCPYCMEHKVQQAEAMKNAKQAILDVAADFEKTFGRKYGFFEEYRMEDAEIALVLIGSTAGTAKTCIDALRAQGIKAGLVKIRVFRPFPMEEVAQALSGVKAVAVMDKCEGNSACGGPLFAEVRSACYDLENRPKMINVVYGLAGRDCAVEDIEKVYRHLLTIVETGELGPRYIHMGQRSNQEEVL
jgi:pyruvate ferredoxin oxidoreductase alpha subunit